VIKQVLEPEDRKLRILFVGRFDRQKGFDIFLEVVRRLDGRALGTAVGSYFVSNAEELPIPKNVTVLGWRSREELVSLYKSADLLLVPSRWEGFGLVAVEAMRAVLPVFASRVGGLQEVVADGETGRLFENGNVQEITKMLEHVSSPELQLFGQKGHARYMEHFTASVMSDRVTALYEDICSATGHPISGIPRQAAADIPSAP